MFCNRDIKVEELKKMVTEIRDNTFIMEKPFHSIMKINYFIYIQKYPKVIEPLRSLQKF